MGRSTRRGKASEADIIDGRFAPRSAQSTEADATIENIAWLMDNSIPIGGYRIGLDPILGLIPGIGDLLTGAVSAVLIVQAHRTGIAKATVLRMIANVGIDSALGAIPFIGDFFDFAWKANSKNLELYRSAIRGQRRPSADWVFLAVVLAVLGVLVSIPILLAFWALSKLF
jgi:hypothetical protein